MALKSNTTGGSVWVGGESYVMSRWRLLPAKGSEPKVDTVKKGKSVRDQRSVKDTSAPS